MYMETWRSSEKKIGGDIIENKKTYLLIKAFELAGKEDRDLLQSWIDKKEFDAAEKVKAVTEIYNRLGIRELTLKTIENYLQKSREALDKIEVERDRKSAFYEMINYLGERKK